MCFIIELWSPTMYIIQDSFNYLAYISCFVGEDVFMKEKPMETEVDYYR